MIKTFITGLIAKLRTAKSIHSKRFTVATVFVLVVIIVGSSTVFLLSRNRQSDVPREYSYKNQAYDLVATWGTYSSLDYDTYRQSLKPQLTDDLYRSTFSDVKVAEKKDLLSKVKVSYTTLPLSTVDEVKLVNSSDKSFEAEVIAEEQSKQPDGTILYDLITYRITFVKQKDVFLASQVSGERESANVFNGNTNDNAHNDDVE